jgi:hypothetical protein
MLTPKGIFKFNLTGGQVTAELTVLDGNGEMILKERYNGDICSKKDLTVKDEHE